MTTQTTPELGKLIGVVGVARRDAVHVAVAPVVALQRFRPGDRVGVAPDGRACFSDRPVGIVDPFLPDWVEPGQAFWLCLFPGTVTSLRHVWTHGAFAPRPPGTTEEAQGHG